MNMIRTALHNCLSKCRVWKWFPVRVNQKVITVTFAFQTLVMGGNGGKGSTEQGVRNLTTCVKSEIARDATEITHE